jgi:A/G-specific adenine glycosylase
VLSEGRAAPIALAIEEWFAHNARDLPWRRRRSGYRALVSEAMLQQTQVKRVIVSFEDFLRRFPDVFALAAADEEDVLAAWRGLGYYRRALNLHRAAIMIRDRCGGRVPRSVKDLLVLPGVGRYTAGAIASIVYGERAAIVDGNISRVLLRVLGCSDPPDATRTKRDIWRAAQALVDGALDPAALNEGLMEVGALICTPHAPKCGECPLARRCAARRAGLEATIPSPGRRAIQRSVHHHAVIIRRGDLILLEKRCYSGLWAGMWQIPTVEAEHLMKPAEVAGRLRVPVRSLRPAGVIHHRTTHRRIAFHIFKATSRAKAGNWRRISTIDRLPMSNPQRRILAQFAK